MLSGAYPKNALKICASLRCNLLKYARARARLVCQPPSLWGVWLVGGTPSCYPLDSGFWGIAALHRLSLWGDPHPAVTVGGTHPAVTVGGHPVATSTTSPPMNHGFSSMREIVKIGLGVASDGPPPAALLAAPLTAPASPAMLL